MRNKILWLVWWLLFCGTLSRLPAQPRGTVSSVSCVSGCTVTNPTTTPAITVTASGGSPAGSAGATQYNNSGSFGGVGPGTTGNTLASNGAGVAPAFKPTGVFNVRLMYGAVPDGSTDNSTAITNAFTASNLFTTGIPTVYFDCDTGATTCQYNYAGSGTSPINPTIPTTISCAPGVYLNYTGSANAVDVGSSGRSFSDELPYTIQGCVFTGAASSTEGININAFITNTYILNNTFFQFGNRTGFNIYYAGSNWESLVQGNSWYDHDGVTRNILDAHNAGVNAIYIFNNNVECDTSIHAACSTTTIGVGFWISGLSKVVGNKIQFHGPNVRLANTSSGTGDRATISNNHFEGNSGVLIPSMTYGDPGGTATQLSCLNYSNNTMFYPAGTGTPMVGPETPASSTYVLRDCPFLDNEWGTPSSGTFYVNTNGGSGNEWGRNQTAGTILTASFTSPSVFDNNSNHNFLPQSWQKSIQGVAGSMMAFGAVGTAPTSPLSLLVTNQNAAGETWTFYNSTGTTGKTLMVWREGAGAANSDAYFPFYQNNGTTSLGGFYRYAGGDQLFLGLQGVVWGAAGSNFTTYNAAGGIASINIASSQMLVRSTFQIGWTSTADIASANDASLDRNAAGIIGVSAAGLSTTAANVRAMKASGYIVGGTAFTLSANACSADTLLGGSSRGSFISRTTGSCTVTVLMGNSLTAPNGFHCTFEDHTTPANFLGQTGAADTTHCSMTGTTVSGDLISFGAEPY